MNVIFLDFDGVLDTYHYNSLEDIERRVKILAEICRENNCKIVIEASAKDAIDEETLEIEEGSWVNREFELFKKYGIECIGRTPNIVKKISDVTVLPIWKEDEIMQYLKMHPEIKHYCIIDDDDLTDLDQKSDLDKVRNHLIKTRYYIMDNRSAEGLQPYHIEEVGKILKLENDYQNQIK